MCLLTFVPAGVMPDTDALLTGAMFNDDGHGFAIVVGDKIVIDRGMDAKEMVYTFEAVRRRFREGPALFHSRLATDGMTNLLNCHPFMIGGDSRTVMAHNGIMPIRPSQEDPRSDTRIIAEEIIPKRFGTLRRRRARLAFERWMGKWNKVVILSVDPRFRGNAFILNEDEGTWDKSSGIWYSNNAYQGYGYGRWHYDWDDGDLTPVKGAMGPTQDITCKGCGAKIHGLWISDCPTCLLCFDCGEYPDYCLCYVPGKPTAFESDAGNDQMIWVAN